MEMEFYIYVRPKNEPQATATRFNDEAFKASDVAKGRADQLAVQHADKVFSVVRSVPRK